MCSIWEMDNKTITLNLACVNRSSETGGEDGVGNPIGELQEFTQKKLMKPPIYEFSNEQGPPHNREFVCTIKLGKFVEKGVSLWCGFSNRNVTAIVELTHTFLMFSRLPTLCLAAVLDTWNWLKAKVVVLPATTLHIIAEVEQKELTHRCGTDKLTKDGPVGVEDLDHYTVLRLSYFYPHVGSQWVT